MIRHSRSLQPDGGYRAGAAIVAATHEMVEPDRRRTKGHVKTNSKQKSHRSSEHDGSRDQFVGGQGTDTGRGILTQSSQRRQSSYYDSKKL